MAKAWVFTVNNWIEEDWECLVGLSDRCNYMVIGKEVGEVQGTPHLQGYMKFLGRPPKKAEVLGMLSERLGRQIYLRAAHGSVESNRAYCTKNEDFFEKGEVPKGRGARSDLIEFRDAIKAGTSKLVLYEEQTEQMARFPKFYEGYKSELNRVAAIQQFRDNVVPEVTVIWGGTGSGKTREVFENHPVEEIYKAGVQAGKSEALWWDGYDQQEVILLDDFYGQWRPEYILNLLDRYPFMLNIKGGTRWRLARKIYITSNVHPREWYANGSVPKEVRDAIMRRIHTIKEINIPENNEA